MAFFLFRKGTSRRVIVVPALGLVFKFARIRLWAFLTGCYHWFSLGGWTALKRWCSYDARVLSGARNFLFGGTRQNWNEWRLSRTRHPLLARTYLSLGVMNVQEYVPAFPGDHDLFYQQVIRTAVDSAYIATCPDPHSLYFRNFGLVAGRVRMVDYGSRHMPEFVRRFGDAICDLHLTPP